MITNLSASIFSGSSRSLGTQCDMLHKPWCFFCLLFQIPEKVAELIYFKKCKGTKETLERKASVNARLSRLNKKWGVLIVIYTAAVPAACSQMFEKESWRVFNNLKVNSGLIEFRVDGLVCEICSLQSLQALTRLCEHTHICFCIWSMLFLPHSPGWVNGFPAATSQSAPALFKDILEDIEQHLLDSDTPVFFWQI